MHIPLISLNIHVDLHIQQLAYYIIRLHFQTKKGDGISLGYCLTGAPKLPLLKLNEMYCNQEGQETILMLKLRLHVQDGGSCVLTIDNNQGLVLSSCNLS